MKIFSGRSNPGLAQEIAAHMKVPLGDLYLHSFPSGESYCQYKENIRGEHVFLIQSTSQPANDNLMELLVMADAARRASAGPITAVIPYFGYGRQDRKDKSRVPISSKLILNMLESAGINRVLSLDLHNAAVQGMTDIPFDHLYTEPVFLKHILDNYGFNQKLCPEHHMILSPDVGGVKRAEAYADKLGVDFGFIVKDRLGDTEVKASKIVGNIKDKKVFIVDDVTESCGTIIQAAKIAKENGATYVCAYIGHGAFTRVGYQRIEDNPIVKIHISDSIRSTNLSYEGDLTEEGYIERISIAPLIGDAITAIVNNTSVSKLF